MDNRVYGCCVDGEFYEIYRYYVPQIANRKLKYLRKYFSVLDGDIPPAFKLRKHPLEFAEVAVMILARIDQICRKNIVFAAGSRFLDDKPWAVFGNTKRTKDTKLIFKGYKNIADYYYDSIVKGDHAPQYFYFRIVPSLVQSLADKYNQTPHFVMSLAIMLLYDIIDNCGPDCEELSDLFRNDSRTTDINISEWENIRCRVMGKYGRIKKPSDCKIGQIYRTPVPLVSSIDIRLLTAVDDLTVGAVTRTVKYNYDCDVDLSVEYMERVASRIEKYKHLGLGPTPTYA